MPAIYKICSAEEWQQALRVGRFEGSDVDRRDGFMHFSSREQVGETAAKHFAGRKGLVLVVVSTDRLGPALKWESSRGGALFPHLYEQLDAAAAIKVMELPDDAEVRAAMLKSL